MTSKRTVDSRAVYIGREEHALVESDLLGIFLPQQLEGTLHVLHVILVLLCDLCELRERLHRHAAPQAHAKVGRPVVVRVPW